MTFSRMAKSGGCALAALALAGAAAQWAEAASLRDSLGATTDDRFSAPMEGRFRSESGINFVLDRGLSGTLLLRMEPSPEIWVLRPQPGPRGDVNYKNDVGAQVLRATRVGGLILFTPDHPGGAAAAFMGDGPTLRLPVIPNPAVLLQALELASARAGRAAQRTIQFEAVEPTVPSWPLVADAALVASQAFGPAAQGGRSLVGWRRVQVVGGKSAAVSAQPEGTLRITVDVKNGLGGRPSSLRIAEVLAKPPKR